MRIIKSIKQMQEVSQDLKRKGKTIGFVPTMGALHQGHFSLMRRARKENDIVIVSIFVNPLQFGPKEDFQKYPRDLKSDAGLCKKKGVDIIFYPAVKEMYVRGFRTYVRVEGLSDVLCGKFRPGHFRGVATVVTKLFNIVLADVAYFGQKDAQQAIILKRMVEDLSFPLKIRVLPTVRDKDGLAMSSRNAYLSQAKRKEAAVLYQALNVAQKLIRGGKKSSADIIRKIKRLIEKRKTVKVQYIAIVNLDSLKPEDIIKGKVLIALAVLVGKTRLIDNIVINSHD